MAAALGPVARAAAPLGEFLVMTADTARALARRPFPAREFSELVLALMRVSIGPTLMLTVPFVGIVIFLFNQLLSQLGAIDVAGGGTGFVACRTSGRW